MIRHKKPWLFSVEYAVLIVLAITWYVGLCFGVWGAVVWIVKYHGQCLTVAAFAFVLLVILVISNTKKPG